MILSYQNNKPVIDDTVFVAVNASVIGQVYIEKHSSIWFGAILRGDLDCISIGHYTSVQDGTIIHVGKNHPTKIGNYVTIGHGAILHACTVQNNVLIGSGANILDGVEVGESSIIAAGSVISPNTIIPANSMVMGIPGKVIRKLTEKEIAGLKEHALHYSELMKNYK